MSLWHTIKVRLGLAEDWDDDGYEYDDEYEYEDTQPTQEWRPADRQDPYGSGAHPGAVRRVDRTPDFDRARVGSPSLHSIPSASMPSAAQVKMHIVQPKSFAEAQGIGDKFKQGTPVILNLSGTSPDLAKRLIDFTSGLTYGLDGGLQKVSEKVFMLTPANVDVSDADRRRLKDTGFFPNAD